MNVKSILILLAIAAVLAGCSGWPNRAAGEKPQDSPEQVVQRFYNWYLDDMQAAPKDARQSGVLTEELAAKIEAGKFSNQPVATVNFVCAQDFPESVTVGAASVEGDQATVPVETSWGGRLEISLVSPEDAWLIDDVQCVR
jgi:hypothetical protein